MIIFYNISVTNIEHSPNYILPAGAVEYTDYKYAEG